MPECRLGLCAAMPEDVFVAWAEAASSRQHHATPMILDVGLGSWAAFRRGAPNVCSTFSTGHHVTGYWANAPPR
jgi:hypothetical protein